ncbi:hypothetical protein [Bosea sp. LjRoot237]|uniref:hypothetical protein n=1 Tax=Bosea sp. LjRoot237 TaxID=3342292 RepID=UPI003ECF332B
MSQAELKLMQVRAIYAWPGLADVAVRSGCAVVAGTESDWLLAHTEEFVAIIGAGHVVPGQRELRHLTKRAIVEADTTRGLCCRDPHCAHGGAIDQNLDAPARRLRKSRRNHVQKEYHPGILSVRVRWSIL